jgi:hypothetical protein
MSTSTAPTVSITQSGDHRGSWIPTPGMIVTRLMELRKRRGLMITLIFVNIGIPAIFLVIRLIMHATDPKSYGPAGGYDIFTNLTAGVMFIFGFIVAATLGCTAGSIDLTEGMFRHLVITGRSRVALYLARIPAGLAIIVPMIAVGFTIVCAVCVFAAPAKLNYQGLNNVPAGLSQQGLDHWATDHAKEVVCGLPSKGPTDVPCFVNSRGVVVTPPGNVSLKQISQTKLQNLAKQIANENYQMYSQQFLKPSTPLMIKTGLWIELEAVLGLMVGLGLSSLMGQRTVPVILLIVLELVLTPLLVRSAIPHLINVQRGIVGLAMAHIEPSALPRVFGGGNGPLNDSIIPESTTTAVSVIVGWLVVWTGLGAWRMSKRDA